MYPAKPNYPPVSLYVGDLHPDVTELELFEKFSEVGLVLSITICRDKNTHRSRGYAYVIFRHPADAKRALDTLNFNNLKGKHIRIMWPENDSSVRKSGVGNIFIKNLEKTIDNKGLNDMFSTYGKILSCKVCNSSITIRYGFVHFETEKDANNAIDKVNGMLINGKKVYVGKFIPSNEREINSVNKDNKFTNIFIKNLKKTIDNKALYDKFSAFGNILSCKVTLISIRESSMTSSSESESLVKDNKDE
ncbi:Polyadenylate-binding protein 1 [Nymphon striatum]|nr:Polyadenylate-binding protein 1 [Nymphon striatum]